MDKKTIIGIVLMLLIFVGFFIYQMPSKEEREQIDKRNKEILDSTKKAVAEQNRLDSLEKIKPIAVVDSSIQKNPLVVNAPDSLKDRILDSIAGAEAKGNFGVFSSAAVGEDKKIVIETEKLILTFSTKGGKIYAAAMNGYQSYNDRFKEKNSDTLQLWVPEERSNKFGLDIEANGKLVNTNDLYFITDAKSEKFSGDVTKKYSFKALVDGNANQYIEYVYTIKGNDYMVDFEINFVGLDKVISPNATEPELVWSMTTPYQEKNSEEERKKTNFHYYTEEDGVEDLKDGFEGSSKEFPSIKTKWISFKQQFFSVNLISNEQFQNMKLTTELPKNEKQNLTFISNVSIPYNYNPTEKYGMKIYMGPNHINTLKTYDLKLEKLVDLGWFGFVNKLLIIPVFNFFDNLHWSYGLIIFMLTIIIKIITVPFTYKTFVSGAKMRLLKPETDEINAKFPDPGDAMKKQQEMMALYRKAGVSPLAGCLPALLQMPFLLAMISFFPAAFELRQQGFLWAEDLASFDSIATLPFKIPMYGQHVSLFALLMTASTVLYTWMNSGQMTATGGVQAQQMKIMMYVMPIFFLLFLNSYSSALSYYYLLSNIVAMILMLIIRKFFIDETKLRAKIDENKKKPTKKSKWMQRLEDAQKMRQEQIRQSQSKQKGGNKK